jgi:hypothetical protein
VRKGAGVIVKWAVIVGFAASLLAGAVAWVNNSGVVVPGTVIEKRESFQMLTGDRWRHIFEIKYRFRAQDSANSETASHLVDRSLYGRLRIGSRVLIRYSPWRWLRPMEGVGSALVDSTWVSRHPGESGAGRVYVEIASLGVVALLAFVAYWSGSRPVALAAGLVGATWISAVLLAGFLVMPLLFWLWQRYRGKGYGWLLLGTVILSGPALYLRVPFPPPVAPGAQVNTTAIVRQVRIVRRIWSTRKTGGGQDLRQPFQMAELEFTPVGASEPVHILDRVDQGSVAGLTEGGKVRVSYPVSDPRAGRIAEGSRTYADQTLSYNLELNYIFPAVFALVVFPVIRFLGKWADSVPIFRALNAAQKSSLRVPQMTEDDPRRRVIEALKSKALPK